MTTYTSDMARAVIATIDAIQEAAPRGLTRGEVNAIAHAVHRPEVRTARALAEVIDPQHAIAPAAERGRVIRLVHRAVMGADPEAVAALAAEHQQLLDAPAEGRAQEEAAVRTGISPQLQDALLALDARAHEAAEAVTVAEAYLAHCYETGQHDAVGAAHVSLAACRARAAEAAAALVTVEKFR